jgi:two-component system CheB/CheR fusion protein
LNEAKKVQLEPGNTSDDGRRRSKAEISDGAGKKAAFRRRVLVVEDNLDTVHSLVFLLRDMGHQVDFAINGYAAVTLAQRMHPEFVFLDLGLPGLDGFQVCKQLKADPALKNVRVIAITGYPQEEYRRRSQEAGCELHLVKPVRPEVLEQLLSEP